MKKRGKSKVIRHTTPDEHETVRERTPVGRSPWKAMGGVPMLLAVGLILSCTALLYQHTRTFDAVLDDHAYIIENPLLKDSGHFLYPLNFKEFNRNAILSGLDSDLALNFITRPVAYATFYWNRLAGGHDLAGYRVVNMIIHAFNGVLLFFIGAFFCPDRGSSRWRRTLWAPGLAALLFTVHPLATESVTYVTQRFESLSTLFILAAVASHLAAYELARGGMASLLRMGTWVFTLLAMLSKETGFVAPLLVLLLDWLCLGSPVRQALCRARSLLLLLPLLPALIVASTWAQQISGPVMWNALNITNIGVEWFSPLHYLLTQVCASMSYLRLLVLPVGQSFDRDYPLITSLWDLRLAGALLLIAGLVALGILCRRRWGVPEGGLVLAGLLWYFVALAPSSSVVPLPDLFSEHRCYLPSVGVFLAFSALMSRVSRGVPGLAKAFVQVGGLVAVMCLAVATQARNEVLRTEESIYRDAIAKSPGRYRVWNGLGVALARNGRLEEALPHFRKATELQQLFMDGWENQSLVLLRMERYPEALTVLNQGLIYDPRSASMLYQRGLAFLALRRTDEAVFDFQNACRIAPSYQPPYLWLARVAQSRGQDEMSLRFYQRAMRIGPLPKEEEYYMGRLVAKMQLAASSSQESVSE